MYKKIAFATVLLGLLTMLLAACTIRDSAAAVAGPTVHMGGADFLQKSVTIKKGDSVNLVDDSTSPHTIVNGSWVGSEQKPAQEPGAPTVKLQFNGNDSAPMGPFNTAGTFHVYCTIHQGMNLEVIVQ
jgi:plastocyanin